MNESKIREHKNGADKLKLPHDWEWSIDTAGRVYYHNPTTKEKSWTNPKVWIVEDSGSSTLLWCKQQTRVFVHNRTRGPESLQQVLLTKFIVDKSLLQIGQRVFRQFFHPVRDVFVRIGTQHFQSVAQ